jgi:Pyridoxamine 5'-phosphate oxidase
MAGKDPTTELEPQFSADGATATPWPEAESQLKAAKAYWISTVRPDGRPHVTTIAAVWLDGALHFTTGAGERKAKNLEHNTNCVITTGSAEFAGLDIVVEGAAARVTDAARLGRLAAAYISKYDRMFVFHVRDGNLRIEGSEDAALAFEVRPTKAFGFGKGESFSQTRWRF